MDQGRWGCCILPPERRQGLPLRFLGRGRLTQVSQEEPQAVKQGVVHAPMVSWADGGVTPGWEHGRISRSVGIPASVVPWPSYGSEGA